MAGEGDYTTAAVNNRAYKSLLRRCAQTDEDRGKVGAWAHNAGLLDNALRDATLDDLCEQSESLASSSLSFKKASRKAKRSTNDKLSHAIYAQKAASSKKMTSFW